MRLSPTERVMVSAALMDCAIAVPLLVLGLLSGAASAASEAIRTVLLTCIDIFSLSILLAVNRKKFSGFEFGIEKLQIFVQIVIAVGMCISIVFIGGKVYAAFASDDHIPNYVLCVVFALFSYVNVLINAFNLRRMVRQEKAAPSLIVRGQIKNRMVMLTSSVVATISAAAVIIPDAKLFALIDATGAVVVLSVIVYTTVRMLKAGVLTLLDAPIEERDKLYVFRELTERFDAWDSIAFVRTRRLGYIKYVEVGLTFDSAKPLETVLAACQAMEQGIRGRVDQAFVRVFPVPADAAA